MQIGDLVKLKPEWLGECDYHGIIVRISPRCGNLNGHVVVKWFGIHKDEVKAHAPRDIRLIPKK